MTEVGTVINEGDEIPADVTGLADRNGDPWTRTPVGHWHGLSRHARRCEDGHCTSTDADFMLDFTPLTVAAVRS